MAVLRRLTALVTLLVTLLLVLTESGFACAGASMAAMDMTVATGGGGAAMADMPGMPGMPGMPAASPADAGTGGDEPPAPEEAPCRFPWAPMGCRDMAPCAPATLTAVAWTPRPHAPAAAMLATLAVIAPASIDTPPEPPPPRA